MANQESSRVVWEREGFVPYQVERERAANVPATFVKAARWDTIDGNLGYYARSTVVTEGTENPWVPVEFNSTRICWVEIVWLHHGPGSGNWQAVRPAPPELGLDIFESDFQAAAAPREVPQIPDTTPSRPSSPPSRTDSRASVFVIQASLPPSPRPVTPPIAQLTDQMSTAVITEAVTAQIGTINPETGRMFTTDDAAAARAAGPDRPDPPTHPWVRRTFNLRPPMGFPPPGHPIFRPPGGSPPGRGGGGGFPGGGNPGGGGGGFPGGGGPIQGNPQGGPPGDRLVGNAPFIYNGDHKRAEEFLAAWKLYQRVNRGTSQMDNMYKRSMLFLTYIQGPATTEWVHSISDWLEQAVQVSNEYDQRLWDYTEEAFQRKFGDTLSEERAIAELRNGIKMEGGDLDGFINRFEILVRHAGYDPDHSMVLQKFTDGLPLEMYKNIFNKDNAPTTYQGWREAAINQQRKWVHYRGRLDLFKTVKPKPQFPKPSWNNTHGSSWPKDPNVMDTSPGRVTARVAEVGDFMPGGNRWPQSVNNPANRPNKFQPAKPREVICYCCGNAGHIARNCPQKPPPNMRGPWVGQGQRRPQQGPSRTRQNRTEEQEEPSNVRAVCDDRPAEERAKEWLSNVANEDEEVKNHILHQIMGNEQGF